LDRTSLTICISTQYDLSLTQVSLKSSKGFRRSLIVGKKIFLKKMASPVAITL
jgi:hypothetical protein